MTNSYPWKTIDPKDYIRIESTKTLAMKDVHVLSRLYQPIIGGAAFSLYISLFGMVDFQAKAKGVTVSELLRKIDIGIPDFYQARVKLEGIGLLRVYRSKVESGDYSYEMIPPLSAEEFFKDSLLRTLLIEKIGDRLFQAELEAMVAEAADKTTYEELTRSFLDVYHIDFQNSDVLNGSDSMPFNTPKRPKLAQTIEQTDTFDYTFFKAGLDKNFVKKDSLTDDIKELIYTYHTVYGIDEMTMQQLVLESADVETGVVDGNKLTRNVQRNFQNKAKLKPKAPVEITEKAEGADEQFNDSQRRIIQHAKETPPADYLLSIKEQKNGFVTSSEEWVLKELVEQSPLSKEVINILLNYILVGRENPVLDKNYTMKIANDWAQSGVRSAEDAMKKLIEMYTQSQQPASKSSSNQRRSYNRNYQKPKRQGKLPDWAKEDSQTKSQTDELVSAEESESFQERLQRLRKLRDEKRDQ